MEVLNLVALKSWDRKEGRIEREGCLCCSTASLAMMPVPPPPPPLLWRLLVSLLEVKFEVWL